MASMALTLMCLLACGHVLHALTFNFTADKENDAEFSIDYADVATDKDYEAEFVGALVNDTVEASSSQWKLVFRQTGVQYTSASQYLTYRRCSAGRSCSELNRMSQYKQANGKFHLKLTWPELRKSQEWMQRDFPLSTRQNGRSGSKMALYQAINTPYTGNQWGGLEYNGREALMDGSMGRGWWYSVGADTNYPPPRRVRYGWRRYRTVRSKTITGPDRAVSTVELYTRCGTNSYTPWAPAGQCTEGNKDFNSCTVRQSRRLAVRDPCGRARTQPTTRTTSCKCPAAVMARLKEEQTQRKQKEERNVQYVKDFVAGFPDDAAINATEAELWKMVETAEETFKKTYAAKAYCKDVAKPWGKWSACSLVMKSDPTKGCSHKKTRVVDTKVPCGSRVRTHVSPCACPKTALEEAVNEWTKEWTTFVHALVKAQPPQDSTDMPAMNKELNAKLEASPYENNDYAACAMEPWEEGTCAKVEEAGNEGCVLTRIRFFDDEAKADKERACLYPEAMEWPCVCPCVETEYSQWTIGECTNKTAKVVDGCIQKMVRTIEGEIKDKRPYCLKDVQTENEKLCDCPENVREALEKAAEEEAEALRKTKLDKFFAQYQADVEGFMAAGGIPNAAKELETESGQLDKTEYEAVFEWKLIFRQIGYDETKTKPADWLVKAPCGNDTAPCSELADFATFKQPKAKKFHLKLKWPELPEGQNEQEWLQVNPPKTEDIFTSEVEGYTAVQETFEGQNWGGLEYNGVQCLWDGAVGTTNWWYALGVVQPYPDKNGTKLPGPGGKTVEKVELYAQIEAKKPCTLHNWTAWGLCVVRNESDYKAGCMKTKTRKQSENCPATWDTMTAPCVCPTMVVKRSGQEELDVAEIEGPEEEDGAAATPAAAATSAAAATPAGTPQAARSRTKDDMRGLKEGVRRMMKPIRRLVRRAARVY